MSEELLSALALALGLTLALEIGFFFVMGKRNLRDMGLVLLVNILTNPPVVLLYWLAAYYTSWPSVAVIIPLEVLAVLAEGYYYRKYGQKFCRPYIFSAVANAFSFVAGALLQQLF